MHLQRPGDKQNVYLIGDWHGKRHGHQHRLDIMQAARKVGATLIIEDTLFNQYDHITNDILADPSSFDPNAPYHYDPAQLPDDPHALGGLSLFCRAGGVPIINIECRHTANLSISGYPVSTATVFEKFDTLINNEIEQYDDGEVLNRYYQQEINKYQTIKGIIQPIVDELVTLDLPLCGVHSFDQAQCEKLPLRARVQDAVKYYKKNTHGLFLDQLRQQNKSHNDIDIAALDNYVSERIEREMCYPNNDLWNLLTIYLFSGIIEARIIHQIHNSPSQELFVCAGMIHLAPVYCMLKRLGYTFVDGLTGFDASTCVSMQDSLLTSMITLSGDCVPTPVDIAPYFDNLSEFNTLLSYPWKIFPYHEMALFNAATSDDLMTFQQWLMQQKDINAQDYYGQTMLIKAAMRNWDKIVEYLGQLRPSNVREVAFHILTYYKSQDTKPPTVKFMFDLADRYSFKYGVVTFDELINQRYRYI